MRQTAYFEAFDYEGRWYGTATHAAIMKARLLPDLRNALPGRESFGGADGWACKSALAKSIGL
ncbi:hypothetical protein UP09_23780 [Bradyrhizobium sp. LTSP885]|nr:hypothetical protein UP09_23780 [Bradyrhizobium sp. LTSP885]